MGVGCYHTNKETETKAFWIDIDQDDENIWDAEIGNLKYEFEKLGYEEETETKFNNGLFSIILESEHEGKIVIRLEPVYIGSYDNSDSRLFGLAIANHARSYARIGRHLKKEGYPLRIASSGQTSMEY